MIKNSGYNLRFSLLFGGHLCIIKQRFLERSIERNRNMSASVRSMTGYGRGEHIAEERKFTVEMKSVNHRYNDMTIKLPRSLAGLEDKIKILEGDAADILPTLEGPYDVIFMDAAKGQYQAFLPHCLRLLPVGGLLIVDDVLQGGTIAQTRFSVPRRQRTIHKRLRNFLWEITHHDALETSIIPIGDGVALCYKKKEFIPETKTEGETKNAE